jgi:hypothetical protein
LWSKLDCSFQFPKRLIGNQLSKSFYHIYSARLDHYAVHGLKRLMTFQSIKHCFVSLSSSHLKCLSTNKISCQWRIGWYLKRLWVPLGPVTWDQRSSYRNLKLTAHTSYCKSNTALAFMAWWCGIGERLCFDTSACVCDRELRSWTPPASCSLINVFPHNL